MSIAEDAFALTGFFEAEVLVELLLRHWQHPHVDDEEFRRGLLEGAAELLQEAVDGQTLIEDMKPDDLNMIAAIWLAEQLQLSGDRTCSNEVRKQREAWLVSIHKALPSCFCDQEKLD